MLVRISAGSLPMDSALCNKGKQGHRGFYFLRLRKGFGLNRLASILAVVFAHHCGLRAKVRHCNF